MSGYRDRKIFDNCYMNETNAEYIKQSDYHFYPGYKTNINSCINYPTNYTNLFGNKSEEISDRSEIESLLQLRNYVDKHNNNPNNSKCLKTDIDILKSTILNKKIKKYNIDNNLNMCPRGYEILNSKLDIVENREKKINRFTNINNNNNLYLYNGIKGTNQYNNNRFGVNTKLMTKDLYSLKNKNKNKK